MHEVYMLTRLIRELERRGHNARPLRLLLSSWYAGNEFDYELRGAIRTLFCVYCLYPLS